MRILLSWTGSRRELHMFRAGMLLPGTHLQVLRDTQFAGHFDLHHLLCVPETLGDAEETVQELARLDRPPLTTPLVVQLLDPTDHDEIARVFSGALREINRELGLLKNQLWALLNIGTPQMQSVWLLLANMGLVVARFSQSSPGSLAAQSGAPPVREFIADLSHWREPFDFGWTAKPRARPSCAALIACRASHG